MAITSFDEFICVPLPVDLYQSLAERFPDRISSVLESVVWDYLERTDDDFDQLPSGGITWGSLKLPNGTKLRVKKSHCDDFGYAEIENDKIIYSGKNVRSPSQLARKIRNNTSVNAWINIEIKRPQDRDWKLANTFR